MGHLNPQLPCGIGVVERDSWFVLADFVPLVDWQRHPGVSSGDGEGLHLTFLRVLRLQRALRLLRVVRSFKNIYRIVQAFLKAARQMVSLLVLMLLLMLIASLIGMQLFGGAFEQN